MTNYVGSGPWKAVPLVMNFFGIAFQSFEAAKCNLFGDVSLSK